MTQVLILEVNGSRAAGYAEQVRRMFTHSGGTIGRSSDCDLVLSSPSVSRLHASIYAERGSYYINDRSRNGTRLNGRSMAPGRPSALAEGDVVRIDGYDIIVRLAEPTELDLSVPPIQAGAGLNAGHSREPESFGESSSELSSSGSFYSIRGRDRRRGAGQDISQEKEKNGSVTGVRAKYLARWANSEDVDNFEPSSYEASRHEIERMGAEQVHALFRSVVEGLMDTLAARQEVKNSFRLPVTVIQKRDNNPLKFAPHADEALEKILARSGKSFLAREEAFDDAFEDLRYHQMAMLTGMRAAFDKMLQRFDPAQIERDVEKASSKRGRKRGGLIGSRDGDGECWAHYKDSFKQHSDNPEDRFQRLFGDEFVKAYEEQLAALKAQKK